MNRRRSSCVAATQAPGLILTGGRVFSADSAPPWAEALAIGGERVVAVGTNAEISRLAAPATRRLAAATAIRAVGMAS